MRRAIASSLTHVHGMSLVFLRISDNRFRPNLVVCHEEKLQTFWGIIGTGTPATPRRWLFVSREFFSIFVAIVAGGS